MVKIQISNWLNAEFVRNGHNYGKIKDAGKWVLAEEDKFGKDHQVLTIQFPDGTEKDWSLNFTSLKNLCKAYGDETERWAGQIVKFQLVKSNVNGTLKDSIVGDGNVEAVK